MKHKLVQLAGLAGVANWPGGCGMFCGYNSSAFALLSHYFMFLHGLDSSAASTRPSSTKTDYL